MKIKSALLTLMVLLATIGTFAQIPDKPNPPKLVNDFAGILPDANIMEDSLEEFARKTSNQIVVVTINDFCITVTLRVIGHTQGNRIIELL